MRAAERRETLCGELLAHVGEGEGLDDLAMQPVDDRLRRLARHQQAEDDIRLLITDALFGERLAAAGYGPITTEVAEAASRA